MKVSSVSPSLSTSPTWLSEALLRRGAHRLCSASASEAVASSAVWHPLLCNTAATLSGRLPQRGGMQRLTVQRNVECQCTSPLQLQASTSRKRLSRRPLHALGLRPCSLSGNGRRTLCCIQIPRRTSSPTSRCVTPCVNRHTSSFAAIPAQCFQVGGQCEARSMATSSSATVRDRRM